MRAFATRLIKDHRALLHTSRTLSERLDIRPQAPSDSALIKAQAQTLDTLHTARGGAGFDSLVLATQIRVHRAVIASVRAAAGNTRNDELQELLRGVLPVLESHRREAQRLQQRSTT